MKITCRQIEEDSSEIAVEFADLKVTRVFPEALTKQETANRLQSMAAELRGDVRSVAQDET